MTPLPPISAKPRFNLDSTPDGALTATLKDLIEELNSERGAPSNAPEVTIQTLKPLLQCIRRISGRDLNGTTKQFPITAIKALKALYCFNARNHGQLYKLIDPPYLSRRPTFEARTTGVAEHTDHLIALIRELAAHLATAVDPERRSRIQAIILTRSQVLQSIAFDNDNRARCMRQNPANGIDRIAAAWKTLAEKVKNYQVEQQPPSNTLIELLYTYLLNFEMLNHIGEYPLIIDKATIKYDIGPVIQDVRKLCTTLTLRTGYYIGPAAPILSLLTVNSWVKRDSSLIIEIIHKCTKLKVEKRALDGILELAAKIMYIRRMYLYQPFPYNTQPKLDKRYLSVADVLAAMCTVRYQQQAKLRYKPYWRGQKDQGSNILRHLRRNRDLTDLAKTGYIPEGVSQILYNQFNQFYAAILGCVSLFRNRVRYDCEYLRKYGECTRSNDIDTIYKAINSLDEYVDRTALAIGVTP